ncbi:hypothetical protein JHK87_014018 [Glycine soja]|nr:hypothetical protein JHK87_014018 [Glycine soja]
MSFLVNFSKFISKNLKFVFKIFAFFSPFHVLKKDSQLSASSGLSRTTSLSTEAASIVSSNLSKLLSSLSTETNSPEIFATSASAAANGSFTLSKLLSSLSIGVDSSGIIATSAAANIVRSKQYLVTQKPVDLALGYRNPHGYGFCFALRRSIQEGVTSHFKGRAVMTDDKSTMSSTEEDLENIGIFRICPSLKPYKDHFKYRMKRYVDQKKLIEEYEGGLEEFAQATFPVYRNSVYGRWEAQIIGDFNGWDGSNHQIKNQFGVWSIKIPDTDGNSAIPHNSRVKFRFRHGDGVWVDRISAWIKYATPYDGVYWDPPLSERSHYPPVEYLLTCYLLKKSIASEGSILKGTLMYQFKYPRPPKPKTPRIYEAHVGMSSSEPRINSYREFADEILPHIWANNYNTVQLMAVMEHSYYASFGYHVTNFFAVSSRSTPEDLKYPIDKAHSLGLQVLMDVIHSLASNNVTDGLNGFDVGQTSQDSYFHTGDRGYHKLWDSRLFNYANWEVLHATVIAEDVSGMPGLGQPVSDGGIGFDYRLAMAIPDKWIDYLKNKNDYAWSMKEISWSLTNRRYTEKCVSYAESHDQMIHFITMALGGEGYLNFMGNESGLISQEKAMDGVMRSAGVSGIGGYRSLEIQDLYFPQNNVFMNAFDRAMNLLDDNFSFLASTKQIVSSADDDDKVNMLPNDCYIVFERGDLIFVFNFHPENTYEGYKVGCDLPGKYRVVLDSDAWEFGGHGRVRSPNLSGGQLVLVSSSEIWGVWMGLGNN